MSRLARNLTSEIGGRIWVAAIGFIVAPFYMRSLGVEGFGLLSFYVSLSTIANILDLGIATLVNRELARLSTDPSSRGDMRDLVRSFGIVSWSVGLLLCFGVFELAGPIARNFLNSPDTDPATIAAAIRIMGLMLALNLPLGFYWASLLGLQRHALLNLINVAVVTAGAGLNLLGLHFLHPDILIFLGWQTLFLAVKVVAVQVSLWRLIGEPFKARIRPLLLSAHWSFAKASFLFALLAMILSQTDRIVLARYLSLEDYGYYSVAATVIQGTYLLIYPFSVASFPRLSELIATGQEARLGETYHRVCQLLGAVIIPISATVFFNAHAALLAWTNNVAVADQAAPILRVMAIASIVNGLMTVPASLILAAGKLSLINRFNALAVVIQIPAMIFASLIFGGLGAAVVWLGLNVVTIIVLPIMMNAAILKGEWRAWVSKDVLPAALVGVGLAGGLCWIVAIPAGRIAAIATLGAMTLLALGLSVVRIGWVRLQIRDLGGAALARRLRPS